MLAHKARDCKHHNAAKAPFIVNLSAAKNGYGPDMVKLRSEDMSPKEAVIFAVPA